MKKLLIVAALSLFLVGCGEPTIDMSSSEAMGKSVQEMTKDLSPEDKNKFAESLTKTFFRVGVSASTDAEREKLLKEKLDGKTVKEIIEMNK